MRVPRRSAGRVAAAIVAATIMVPASIGLPPSASATSGASPYSVPLVVDTNADPGIVETTITADETPGVDIGGGVFANLYSFNGTVPGPEFRLTVGQRVIVHFQNQLAEPTGIHWHGIELQNPSDGTPLTQNQVPPGGSFLYDFVVTRPGMYWYHPHHEFSTNQVFKGLYGSIIVTDPNEAALIASGVLPPASATRTFALSDITVCKDADPNDDTNLADSLNDRFTYDPGETDATFDSPFPWRGPGAFEAQPGKNPKDLCDTPFDNHGDALATPLQAGDVPNIQTKTGRVNEGQTVLTNGMNVGGRAGSPAAPGALAPGASRIDVNPGQGLRLQLANAATTRFFRLHLTDDTGNDVDLVRVGGEGGLLNEAVLDGTPAGGLDFDYAEGEILLDPGDRADVVVAFPAAASGVWTLWTEDFRRTGGGDVANGWTRTATVPVAHFNVTGAVVSPAYTIGEGTDLRLATGDPVEILPAPTGVLLDPASFPTIEMGMPDQDIELTVGPPVGINHVQGSHDFSVDYTLQEHHASSRWALIQDTLQLRVVNKSPADHPFHLHGFSIQPLSLTECPPFGSMTPGPNFTYPPEFVDNIDVPGNCTLTLRVRLDDRPFPGLTPGGGLGRWMFHCHIFFHHHQGMVGELEVVAPEVDITTVTPGGLVYPIGTEVTVDTDVLGEVPPTYDWDDGGATSVGAATGGPGYRASHVFSQAGVYTVTATVENEGWSDSDSVLIVVYDPSAGFVTGGGTIASPAGAYVTAPLLSGEASFGFVSKYKKGQNVPDGQTEFRLRFADFEFHSSAYQWLVVAGSKAQFKGTGTVNGSGSFGFILTAVDGQLNGGSGGLDRFRIKIWDEDAGDAVVYDNALGASDDIDAPGPQPIGGGSIVIHKAK
ncbi:MAG TPA: multicopper oxidase domain-containing protein [Candidatus Limnocylindrales bacterium]|nr:multicopper oxidase domain-containing protein [Candidatus Limnocylindrales bacterium]